MWSPPLFPVPLLALCLSLVLGGTTSCQRPLPSVQAAVSQPSSGLTHPSRTAVLLPNGQSIADVAAKVTPSVVNIFTERVARRRPSGAAARDVIVEVNRMGTPSVESFRKAAQESDRRALVLVYRDGVTRSRGDDALTGLPGTPS